MWESRSLFIRLEGGCISSRYTPKDCDGEEVEELAEKVVEFVKSGGLDGRAR